MFRKDRWKNKGRWYEVNITSDGTAMTLVNSELPVTVSGTTTARVIVTDPSFIILDSKMDVNFNNTTTVGTFNTLVRTSGKCAVNLPVITTWEDATVWIYGYSKRR